MAPENEKAAGPAHLRLFVAAPLPEWIKDELQGVLPHFQHPAVRFVPRENLHLTLHFIGSFAPGQRSMLEEQLQQVATRFSPFRLQLLEVTPGPTLRIPRLVWARFGQDQTFVKLCQALAETVGPASSAYRHPVPHVTLARFRKDQPKAPNLPVLEEWEVPVFDVGSFALWRSHLGQPHPRYEIVKEFTLTG